MLDKLRKFDLDGLDLDEQIALLVFAKGLRDEYGAMPIPDVPKWLSEKIELLQTSARRMQRDQVVMALKKAEAKRAGLKTEAEKRTETDAEIERLTKALATIPA